LGTLFFLNGTPEYRGGTNTFLLNTRSTITIGNHSATVPTIPLNKAAFAFYRGKKMVAVETGIDSNVDTDVLCVDGGQKMRKF
jgi:hypothetical protein